MSKIVICGKGGCGKSTVTSLMANYLSKNGKRVLVVDCDESNIGINKMLGVGKPETTLMETLGGKKAVMEKFRSMNEADVHDSKGLFDSITFDELPPEAVSWNNGIGMMEVGKIEKYHEGCACPMGILAGDVIEHLCEREDEWVIVDTEAGIEHFGRGVERGADHVLMVADPSEDSALLAVKIKKISEEASKTFNIVINKANDKMAKMMADRLAKDGVTADGVIPFSEYVAETNLCGNSLDSRDVDAVIGRLVSLMD